MHKVKAKQTLKQAASNAAPSPMVASGIEIQKLEFDEVEPVAGGNNTQQPLAPASSPAVGAPISKSNKALFNFMERMKLTNRVFYCDLVSAKQYLTNTLQATLGPSVSVASLMTVFTESGGIVVADTAFNDNDADAVNEVLLRAEVRDPDGGVLPIDASTRAQAKRKGEENAAKRELWTRLCTAEYIKRQEQFRRKATGGANNSTVSTAYAAFMSRVRIAVVGLVVAACLLAYGWPIWDQLLDVESDSHLVTLGLGRSATKEEIKRAYRKLSREYHPDLNPACDDRCREKLMRIQEAYENLIARGVGRDELYLKEQHQYKEALQELRSLIFFRAYGIAVHCAEFVNLIVLGLLTAAVSSLGRNRSVRSTVEKAVQGAVVVGFIVAEIALAGGINVITIMIQLFSLLANMLQTNAIRQQQRRIVKWSNFDWAKDAVFFVLPAVVFQIIFYFTFEKYPRPTEYILRTLLGVAFLGAHLSRFTPNLFDNISLRKCSIPMPYLSLVGAAHQFRNPTFVFRKINLVQAELLLILDDLFAFTLQVPPVFRLMVYLVHVVFLVQMYLLPWDFPVTSRLHQRFHNQKADEELDDVGGMGPLGSADEVVGQATGSGVRKGSLLRVRGGDAVPAPATLSDKERLWLVDLDREQPKWVEVPQIKYSSALRRHAGVSTNAAAANQQQQFMIAVTPNLEEILIASVRPQKLNSKFQELQEMASAQRPTLQILERHRDPLAVEYMVREQGNSVIVPNTNHASNAKPGHLSNGDEERMQAVMAEMMLGNAQPYEREGARTVGESSSLPRANPQLSAPGADETTVMKYRKFGGSQGLQNLTLTKLKSISLLKQRTLKPSAASEYYDVHTNGRSVDDALTVLRGHTRSTWRSVANILAHNMILSMVCVALMAGMYLAPVPSGGGTNRQAGPAPAATAFHPFLTPIAPNKYQGLLPANHELNRFAAGAIVLPPIPAYDVKLPIPVLLPDLFDTLRQLTLFDSHHQQSSKQQQDDANHAEDNNHHHQQKGDGQKKSSSNSKPQQQQRKKPTKGKKQQQRA